METRGAMAIAGVLGVVTPLVTRLLSQMPGPGDLPPFVLPAIVVGVFSWLSLSAAHARAVKAALLFYGVLPIGVALDAVFDSASRNLFPFEIAIWLVLAPLPMLAAYFLRLSRGLASESART
jgi:hypothetical protein